MTQDEFIQMAARLSPEQQIFIENIVVEMAGNNALIEAQSGQIDALKKKLKTARFFDIQKPPFALLLKVGSAFHVKN